MNAIKSTGRLPFPNYELTDNSIEKLEDVTWGNIFILKKYGYRYRLVDSPRGFVGVVVNITEWMPVFSEDLFDSPHTKPMFTVIEASGQEHHFIKYESDKWIYETLDDSSEITREIMIIQLVDLMTNRRLLRLMFSIFIPKALYTFPGLRGRLWRFESYRDVDIYRYSIEFT